MRRAIAILGAFVLLAVPAAAKAAGPPHVTVGISEQSPDLFEDARFHASGIRDARLLVPWDLVKMGGWPLQAADVWLDRARRDGVAPLISFGHSMSPRRQHRLPTVRQY
jgi:hypothetical protein